MLSRRELVRGVIVSGMATLAPPCVAAPDMGPIRTALRETVGTREKTAGMIAVVIDGTGTSTETYGAPARQIWC